MTMSRKVQDLINNARICLEASDIIEDASNKAEAYSKAAVVLSTKTDPDYDDAEEDRDHRKEK
jgi:hypothetical protein